MQISLMVAALFFFFAEPKSATAALPDLTKVEHRLAKEPIYQGKPGYLLLVFGPEARDKAWLVLDGEMIYVDRQGTGDLTAPECKVKGEADTYYERIFKAGDFKIGGMRYGDLQVLVTSVKRGIGEAHREMPMFRKFLAEQPDGKLYTVAIDVPLEKPFADLRDGSPIASRRHFASEYDASGILQFAAKPQDASIIHFGGRWTLSPDGQQKLVRGRNEDIALRLGTPGSGPGTFAFIVYDGLIPGTAKPHLQIEYPSEQGDKSLVRDCPIEDRC
jgi:hypothetical protein